MKKIIQVGIISSILGVFGCRNNLSNNELQERSNERITFQEQLDTFKGLGFTLNPGITISDVDRWGGHDEFEKDPYSLLYITLGQTIEREPWTPLTDRCWDFDTEAIEDHGAYITILDDLQRITRGELKFENIEDYVDLEESKAWVSFTFNDNRFHWDLKVDDDWVDPELFSKIVELTRRYDTKGRYTYYNTGGQNAVIGYETPENLKKINKATGLNIEWLE